MPLQRKRLQTLVAHRALKPVIGDNDRAPLFEAEGTAFSGTLQPMDSPADRQVYGSEAARLTRLITMEGEALDMGTGVEADGCMYRIIQPVCRWRGHCTAVLKKLD